METNPEKFCPSCGFGNKSTASVCAHCGESLEHDRRRELTTNRLKKGESGPLPDLAGLEESLIPAEGVALYVLGMNKPIVIAKEKEFVIGRQVDDSVVMDVQEPTINLSPYGAFKMGISRRHATIRQMENGYEIVDLGSTNGTWLNGQRLVPYKNYPLKNGSQLRMGRMHLLVMLRTPLVSGKK
jgi:hypothetical protein